MLPDNEGLFGVSEGHYAFFSPDGVEYSRLNVNTSESCSDMFVNQACTEADNGKWDRIFIETITGGYHNLFAVSDGANGIYFECLVRRDEPINNKYFTINENGVIEGEYGRYMAYNKEDYEEGEEFTKYNLVERLPNGDCVISKDIRNEYDGNYIESLNILKKGEKEPLLNEWFDEFVDLQGGLYVVGKYKNNIKMIGFFNAQGEQVGEWYEKWGFIDNAIAIGTIGNHFLGTPEPQSDQRKCHFIDANASEVFAEFKELMSSKRGFPKVIVQCNDGLVRGYDYVERKFCYNEFENMKRIISNCSSYLCNLKRSVYNQNGEENVIFNYNTQKIEAENISNISYLNRVYDIFKLVKTNGKYNAYDMSETNGREVLPTDSDTDIQWVNGSILYTSNNRYFLYNYRKNKMILNPNGFDVEPFKTDDYIGFTDGNYDVVFCIGSDNAYFRYWQVHSNATTRNREMDASTPQEVVNLYNRVTGEGQQQQPNQEQEKRTEGTSN